ncbi:hypothetical protein V7S76_09770 [Aquirufa sp. ROCK2-A2]
MKYDINSSRSLLKPFWGENDKTLKLEEVKILGSKSQIIRPFQGIDKNFTKESIQNEIRRVTFKLRMSKSKVFEILKDKIVIDGVELQNLYFFSLKRNVRLKSKKRKR